MSAVSAATHSKTGPTHKTDGVMDMDDVFSPEAIYASWMNMSYFALTTGMLFYHMTRKDSIKADKRLAAVIAISLLVVSVVYVVVAVIPYKMRLDRAVEECLVARGCNKEMADTIRNTARMNLATGMVTVLVEMVICYLIFKTI